MFIRKKMSINITFFKAFIVTYFTLKDNCSFLLEMVA